MQLVDAIKNTIIKTYATGDRKYEYNSRSNIGIIPLMEPPLLSFDEILHLNDLSLQTFLQF